MEQYPDLMSNPTSIVNHEAAKELSDRHAAKLRADTPPSHSQDVHSQDAKLQVGTLSMRQGSWRYLMLSIERGLTAST